MPFRRLDQLLYFDLSISNQSYRLNRLLELLHKLQRYPLIQMNYRPLPRSKPLRTRLYQPTILIIRHFIASLQQQILRLIPQLHFVHGTIICANNYKIDMISMIMSL